MPLSLIRIDDRLIHGQVVEGWAPLVQATRLVVASDRVAAEPAQMALMSLAVPDHLQIRCCSLIEAARCSRTREWEADRVLLLFASPQEVLSWIQAGGLCSTINVGGLHYESGRTQITAALSLSTEDLRVFHRLKTLGIQLEVRALPSEMPVDLWGLLAQVAPMLLNGLCR